MGLLLPYTVVCESYRIIILLLLKNYFNYSRFKLNFLINTKSRPVGRLLKFAVNVGIAQ